MSKTINITNGPSREELFDGLRLFTEKRSVPFTIAPFEKDQSILVIMQGIEAEDGGGQSWNIKMVVAETALEGLVPKMPGPINPADEFHRKICGVLKNVKAYYSTKHRKGVITVD